MQRMTLRRFTLLLILISTLSIPVVAQNTTGDEIPDINYASPRKYTIGGITVTGADYLNSSVLISLSGLQVGNKIDIPGLLIDGDKLHDIIVAGSKIYH